MKITRVNWKVFVISFVGQFIISALLYFGFQTPKIFDVMVVPGLDRNPASLVNPNLIQSIPPKIDPFASVKFKLDQSFHNEFQINRSGSLLPESLVTQAYASDKLAEYDNASAYILLDSDSGQVLLEKNSATQLPIASVTKIITAIVALDLVPPDQYLEVSQKAAKTIPTKIGVVTGEKMTLNELLHALLMTSANDSAEVIKEGIDKIYNSEETFVKAMNYKAQSLGLKNSSFTNPQGFDEPGHLSSAEDVAVMVQYALTNYPLIAEIVKKDYLELSANSYHKKFDLYNWNGLIGVYPGVYGVKIGNTPDAGNTTAVISQRGGKKLIAVVLNAPSSLQRDLWTAQLLDKGFSRYDLASANVTEEQLRAKYATWKTWR